MNQRVLVLYASTHGHTRKIADRIGTQLEASGVTASVRDVREYGEQADLGKYDGVIVAASVHSGHHQKEMAAWISRHHTRLSAMPSAFVSVSLTAADDTDEARQTTRAMIDEVLDATEWVPGTTLPVAGALQFEEYNLATRVLMRLIVRRQHPEADPHHDTDYTDWAEVDRFARIFATTLQTTEVPS